MKGEAHLDNNRRETMDPMQAQGLPGRQCPLNDWERFEFCKYHLPKWGRRSDTDIIYMDTETSKARRVPGL